MQVAEGRLLGESDEFKRPRRVIDKADGDRERAFATSVCRFYSVRTLNALSEAIKSEMTALLRDR